MIGSEIVKDNFDKAYNKLVQIFNVQGYLTEDDFITITEKLDIPLIRLSDLQDNLYSEGIEIIEFSSLTHKKSKSKTTEDASPQKRKTTPKSMVSEKSDKYEILFSEMESSDPQKVRNSFFDDYSMARIQSTYIPVLLLAFLENTDKSGTVLMSRIVDYYEKFYSERRSKNLIVERPDSIFAKSKPEQDAIKRLILFNPLGRSFLKKYFRYDKQTDSICVNTKFWMGMSFADGIMIKEKSSKIIDEYYKKISNSCSADDNTNNLMPYWKSKCSFYYSRMSLLFMYGYYIDGKPLFYTTNSEITITDNQINELIIPEDLYEKLETVNEFTITPFLVFQNSQTKNYSMGIQGYIHDPLDRDGYNSIHAKVVDAPFVEIAPLIFECRITDRKKDVYTYSTLTRISVEIICVTAYSSIVNNGEVDIEKLFGLKGVIDF